MGWYFLSNQYKLEFLRQVDEVADVDLDEDVDFTGFVDCEKLCRQKNADRNTRKDLMETDY
jgi:hypothetical protein